MSSVCKDRFFKWMEKEFGVIPSESFESTQEWKIWKSAWVRAQSYGSEMQRQKFKKLNPPLSDAELKELFTYSLNGKEFGRKVEERHGIK